MYRNALLTESAKTSKRAGRVGKTLEMCAKPHLEVARFRFQNRRKDHIWLGQSGGVALKVNGLRVCDPQHGVLGVEC